MTINLLSNSLGGIEASELIDIRQRFNFHLVGELCAELKAFAVSRSRCLSLDHIPARMSPRLLH